MLDGPAQWCRSLSISSLTQSLTFLSLHFLPHVYRTECPSPVNIITLYALLVKVCVRSQLVGWRRKLLGCILLGGGLDSVKSARRRLIIVRENCAAGAIGIFSFSSVAPRSIISSSSRETSGSYIVAGALSLNADDEKMEWLFTRPPRN